MESKPRRDTQEPVALTEETFDALVLQAATPVLVEFGAPWCGACRTMAPVMQSLAETFDGRAIIGTIDVDAYPDLADRFGIRGLPTLLFFLGGQVVGQATGYVSERKLAGHLEAMASADVV